MQPSTSPAFSRRRPPPLHADGAGGQRAAAAFSSVSRLLADIAYQRQKERRRAIASGRQSRRHRRDDSSQRRSAASSVTGAAISSGAIGSELDDEAASAYWWTDVFLRYFVFDEDCTKTTATADSDDLLFFVRRRRNKRRCIKRRPSSHRRRKIIYDTRAYRKQQHNQQQQQQQQQKPTLLPIGDPAILWRHTVCLNAIVHRLRYTLTVAVCVHVPRKAATPVCFDCCDGSREFESADDEQGDCEYDLQLLSRYVHTVYASTSGRRMDAAKGPRERPVYPALCWAVDDYAEAFRTVIVHPGQTVCAELVATWSDPTTVIEEHRDNDKDDGNDNDLDDSNYNQFSRHKSASVKIQQNQNKAVLFTAAVPYAAVRAAYECKMSLYRDAERQRRKLWRQQQRKRGGKKSSLGATLSASLTALFVGGNKDSAPSSGSADYDGYYGASSSATDADANRVEYVTVRGCRPSSDNNDSDTELSSGDEKIDGDESDFDGDDDIDNCTKGLAQMAVTLAPIQRVETSTSGFDDNSEYRVHHHHHQQQYCGGGENNCGDTDHDPDFATSAYYDHDNDDYATVNGYQQQQLESYTTPATASEPGDFYDYGWDYETAASSEQQTPQTPSYYYQQQQQQQLERQRRRGRKPRRLSDPCSTSVFDQLDNNDQGTEQHNQTYQQQHEINDISMYGKKSKRKQQYNYRHRLQQQSNRYGSVKGLSSMALTPGRSGKMQHPHRAWSESDGLDQCGSGLVQQIRNQQKPQPLLPPPVPYYCAAEAAQSGFVQYVHKSPDGWWTRTKNKRRRRRYQNTKRKHSGKTNTTVADRRRSASAGATNGCTITDDDNSVGSDSGSNSDHGESNSDEQDSDGEFIGALAAAAAFGQDPDREWLQRGNAGDPVADWDRYDCDSDSSAEPDDDNMVEWTTEIIATDIRRKQPYQNCSTVSSRIVHDNSLHFCGEQSPTPVFTNRQLHQQKQQSVGHSQQFHRQLLLPQFRPKPLEPPPPPSLSVAFTAVACPWWTVLEDVLHVNAQTSGEQMSSNKTVTRLPLLTFD